MASAVHGPQPGPRPGLVALRAFHCLASWLPQAFHCSQHRPEAKARRSGPWAGALGLVCGGPEQALAASQGPAALEALVLSGTFPSE